MRLDRPKLGARSAGSLVARAAVVGMRRESRADEVQEVALTHFALEEEVRASELLSALEAFQGSFARFSIFLAGHVDGRESPRHPTASHLTALARFLWALTCIKQAHIASLGGREPSAGHMVQVGAARSGSHRLRRLLLF